MFTWVAAIALALATPTAAVVPQAGTQAQIMAVPPELQARLHNEVLDGRASPQQRLDRLVDFMFDPQGLGMTYQEDATYSVAQAYATRKANCLGFTILFLALAREAGLDATPQEIEQTLAWHQRDGTLYRSNHINAVVQIGGRQYTVDVAGDSVIARDRPLRVSDQRLLAHYYNNLAVMQLAQGQLVEAQRLMAIALELDPDYASHWSNSGVILLRGGEREAAENAYARALALDPDNTNALFNMAGLAHRTGDRQREADYRRRLERLQQKDPFHHFLLAMNYERSGDYPLAIRHFRRAIQLHGDEHRFYSALARAYLGAGDTRRAVKALARAQALSDGDVRAAYRAKLDSLRQ